MVNNNSSGGIFGTSSNCFVVGSHLSYTDRTGCFGASDSAATLVTVGSDNIFQCRFANGYWLATNTANSLGVQVGANGTSWSSISDERTKTLHKELDEIDLNTLDSLKLYQYEYKDSKGEIQFGTTAQSFYAAFPQVTQRKMKFNCGKDEDNKRVTKTSICDGDDFLLLDDKDEKAMLWACIKALNKKVSNWKKLLIHLKNNK